MGLTEALFAFAAACAGYIISDAITDAIDERVVSRFTAELEEHEGFPMAWRLRPPTG